MTIGTWLRPVFLVTLLTAIGLARAAQAAGRARPNPPSPPADGAAADGGAVDGAAVDGGEEQGGKVAAAFRPPADAAVGATVSGVLGDPGNGEFTISLEPSSVKAGVVAFTVENKGTTEHEFVVVKSDLDPAQIPVENEKAEEDSGVFVGEIEELEPGTTRTLEVRLDARRYLIL